MQYIIYSPDWLAFSLFLSIVPQSRMIRAIGMTLVVFLLYFFRGYDKKAIVKDNKLVLSASDGKVVFVKEEGENVRVAVFLDPLDKHVQASPVKGEIITQIYKEGEFHPAYMFEKGDVNERMETTFKASNGNIVKIYQIAGVLARTIMPLVKPNTKVEQGDAFGLIKFGSRVDTLLPKGKVKVLVKPGQVIKIGMPLAQWI